MYEPNRCRNNEICIVCFSGGWIGVNVRQFLDSPGSIRSRIARAHLTSPPPPWCLTPPPQRRLGSLFADIASCHPFNIRLMVASAIRRADTTTYRSETCRFCATFAFYSVNLWMTRERETDVHHNFAATVTATATRTFIFFPCGTHEDFLAKLVALDLFTNHRDACITYNPFPLPFK